MNDRSRPGENDFATRLLADVSRAASVRVVEAVLEWMATTPRPPAASVFPEGPLLKLAQAIEGEVPAYLEQQHQQHDAKVSAAWRPGPWPGWRQLREDLVGPRGDQWYRGPDEMEIHRSSRGRGNRGRQDPNSSRPWWGRKGELDLKDKAGRTRVFSSAERVKELLEAL